jgi:hypothetical protein
MAIIMYDAPFNLQSSSSQEVPELQLWRKVFLLAIEDCRGQSGGGFRSKRDVQRRARAWIFSDSKNPGGFRWCCEVLGVDPRAVYRQVLRAPSSPASLK